MNEEERTALIHAANTLYHTVQADHDARFHPAVVDVLTELAENLAKIAKADDISGMIAGRQFPRWSAR